MTTLKAKQITKAYDWLLRVYGNYRGWKTNDELWAIYAEVFLASALSREEFDNLIKEMKEVEGWV